MRRREFITLLGGAAVWPLAARAQQPERMRRIGILLAATADDAEFQAWVGAFLQALALLGWTIGRNMRVDTRWATANAGEIRRQAAELAALAPDVILAHGASTVGALLQVTRTVPIVFPIATDPVAAGFVESLAQPGGNATGFMSTEYSIGGKWLELLKQTAPGVTRAAVLRDTPQGSGTSQFAAIQSVAPSLSVEVNPLNMRDAGEIERAVTAFAHSPGGGLIVTAGAAATRHRNLIVTLAARHAREVAYRSSYLFDALIEKLVQASADYLIRQFEAGARLVATVSKRIPAAKIIGFPRGAGSKLQRYISAVAVDAHKLPAVYHARFMVAGGGLMSYGPDFIDQYQRAAGYVDR